MIGVSYIQETASPIAGPAVSNLMLMLGRETSDATRIPQHLVPSTPPSTDFSGVFLSPTATQTRHGGSVVKNQPCSQSVLMVEIGIAADPGRPVAPSRRRSGSVSRAKAPANLGRSTRARATFKALWQKPAIGPMAVCKRSPVMGDPTGKGYEYPRCVPSRERPETCLTQS